MPTSELQNFRRRRMSYLFPGEMDEMDEKLKVIDSSTYPSIQSMCVYGCTWGSW